MRRRDTAAPALLVAALALAACSSAGTSTPAAGTAPAGQEAPGSTACPGINCTQQAPASAPASTPATGPVGTTFTATYYGANGNDPTFKIRLVRVTDPAKLSDPTQLSAGASHAAALEFYVAAVTGTLSGPDPMYGVQATGTDGEVFSVPFTTAIDTDVYLSSSAQTLVPGEHGTWWDEIDLPAGVRVKSVRYLDKTIYTPPGAAPVTWTVAG